MKTYCDTVKSRTKLNIASSMLLQLVTAICGFILPRFMIGAFGSEMNGAVTSITQFLAYITLLQGGIGGVARAALYKPLSANDSNTINNIYTQTRSFFRGIATVFVVYTIALASSFNFISSTSALDWGTSFALVIIISGSTLVQYFCGMSDLILIMADRYDYVISLTSAATTFANMVLSVTLISVGCNVITVKIASSMVFVLHPIIFHFFVKKRYHIQITENHKELTQKWAGLGQHIAYYIHHNTDVIVLTIFSDLKKVSIYAVYSMIVNNVSNITSSFTSGMEALFGRLLAQKKTEELEFQFSRYDTLISISACILHVICLVLIIPFISVYMKGVDDADYIQPVFSVVLVLASLAYRLRGTYGSVIYAAGHFRQTQWAAYIEALLNIGISIALVRRVGLSGVAIGTLVAMVFRTIYSAWYVSKHIMYRPLIKFVKRQIVNIANIVLAAQICVFLEQCINVDSYLSWVLLAIPVSLIVIITTLILNYVFYRSETEYLVASIIRR